MASNRTNICILGLLLVFGTITFVLWEENMLPIVTIKNDKNEMSNEFSEANAIIHLNALAETIGIRRAGEHSNEVEAVKYMVDALQDLDGVEIEIQRDAGSFTWTNKSRGNYFKEPVQVISSGNYMLYQNLTNVVIRIQPPHIQDSILLSAHFDTAKTSPGASDDTIHVCVLMELARVLSLADKSEWKYGVVLLLNGAEEVGLLASHMFMASHKWAKDVKAWINLESTGAGGRLMFFRGMGVNHGWLTRVYASINPFGSSMAEELYNTGVLPGYTDGEVYGRLFGIPGIDLLLYQNAYVYHSPLDNVSAIGRGTLQGVGDTVVELVDKLVKMGVLSTESDDNHLLPFFGVVGHDAMTLFVRILAGSVVASALMAFVLMGNYRRVIVVSLLHVLLCVAGAVTFTIGMAWVLKTLYAPLFWFSLGPYYVYALFGSTTLLGYLLVASLLTTGHDFIGIALVMASVTIGLERVALVAASYVSVQLFAVCVIGLLSRHALSLVLLPVPVYMIGQTVWQLLRNLVPMCGRVSVKVPADLAVASVVAVSVLLMLGGYWAIIASTVRRSKAKYVVLVIVIAMCVLPVWYGGFNESRQQRIFLQHTIETEPSTLPHCGSIPQPNPIRSFLIVKTFGGPMIDSLPGVWLEDDTYPGIVRGVNIVDVEYGSLCVVDEKVDNGKKTLTLHGEHGHTPHSHITVNGSMPITWSFLGDYRHCADGVCAIEIVSNDVRGWTITLKVNSDDDVSIQYGIQDYQRKTLDMELVLESLDDKVAVMLSPRTSVISNYSL